MLSNTYSIACAFYLALKKKHLVDKGTTMSSAVTGMFIPVAACECLEIPTTAVVGIFLLKTESMPQAKNLLLEEKVARR